MLVQTDDAAQTDSVSQSEISDRTDLRDSKMWESYYRKLRKIGRAVENNKGWPLFSNVFMVSALSGDGIVDLKVR